MTKIKIGAVSSGRSLVDTTRELTIEKGELNMTVKETISDHQDKLGV
jgi:hypothetical protein